MPKSTIKSIYEIRPVTTKRGKKYKFDLMLEDETRGRSSLQTTKEALKLGQTIDYTISDDQYKTIVIANGKRNFSSSTVDREKQKVLKALELGVHINTKTGLNSKTEDAMASADLFLQRLTDKGL